MLATIQRRLEESGLQTVRLFCLQLTSNKLSFVTQKIAFFKGQMENRDKSNDARDLQLQYFLKEIFVTVGK